MTLLLQRECSFGRMIWNKACLIVCDYALITTVNFRLARHLAIIVDGVLALPFTK
jgi:hypothetical protein